LESFLVLMDQVTVGHLKFLNRIMLRDFKTLAITTAVLIVVIVALTFTIFRTPTTPPETIVIEDEVDTTIELRALIEGNQTQLTIQTFGGEKNVKTFFNDGTNYALTRNPAATGDRELAIIEPFGNYYYSEQNEERIPFATGKGTAKYGYEEVASISGELLRELNTDTEYFVAYPDSLSAGIAGIEQIPDSGSSNRFLGTQFAAITNINNNVTVIAEIVHRGEEQGVLNVSERTRKTLGLSNGAIGNLEIGLISKDLSEVGAILPFQK